jgi:fructose transport system permease protein
VIAIGQTLIVLTGGIDLSCGMVMAFGSIIMTKFAVTLGLPPALAILCGIGASTLFGMLNGVLITRIKLPAFIVTLGTLNIAFALTQIYSNAESVSNLPDAIMFFGNTFRLGPADVTYGTVLTLLMYLATWFVLRDTVPGRHLYALGNNAEAARLMEDPADRLYAGRRDVRHCCVVVGVAHRRGRSASGPNREPR